jgi:hypothetical protein
VVVDTEAEAAVDMTVAVVADTVVAVANRAAASRATNSLQTAPYSVSGKVERKRMHATCAPHALCLWLLVCSDAQRVLSLLCVCVCSLFDFLSALLVRCIYCLLVCQSATSAGTPRKTSCVPIAAPQGP